ncbi:BlaI/MecI/CopY family transcriptional regulator [Nocardioides sp. BP30]|uniref:BlaI/MecI/CopY family transcriptional regulator n=1 Tax=Nocardioides sp. BP30 TaxID=3036374 RepID=UPI002468AA6C|nr:BlaI/MecI/CopY family transcriptional regulator [Nocardioides sp. BP30]WGL51271.1 BlaI/MecI/CopY family transcriptional regulator [Nocardioides sp. BP30]
MTTAEHDGGRRRHGALRDEVLGVLLHSPGSLTAREVADRLAEAGGPVPAITTVLTVLDRLRRSGEVEKAKVGGELRFSVARHDADLTADDMLAALLRSKDRTGALLSFAGALSDEDLAALRRLVGSD